MGAAAPRQQAKEEDERAAGATLFFSPAHEETRWADEKRERGGGVEFDWLLVKGAESCARQPAKKANEPTPKAIPSFFFFHS